MGYQNVSRLSRRTFLFASFVAAVGRATTYAQQQARIPETLTQWLGASARMRKLALQRCLDRIQTMEPSIHAWVQVSPQRNATRGRLSGIPYGVKDIVETRGLATEYGSPIYKGRIGNSRCRNHSRDAEARSDFVGEDANDGFRILDARAHTQPA
jgi:aspartyl-tRNA(Asn)/glutamyl-tRNA(Gln) amidotransferase subunit A